MMLIGQFSILDGMKDIEIVFKDELDYERFIKFHKEAIKLFEDNCDVAEAVAKETERCASICDERARRNNDGYWTDEEWEIIRDANTCAADAIRGM